MEDECESTKGANEVSNLSNTSDDAPSIPVDQDNQNGGQREKNADEPDECLETEKGSNILRLPLARIKKIMKGDPELGLASQDSVFLIAKATELFIESLVVESYQNMINAKKKTIAKRDFDTCIEKIDSLAFLDGALDDLT